MKIFGERLRDLRKKRRLTQVELGKEVNVTSTAISYYEKGEKKPAYETLVKLADFFDVSLDYLLGRVDSEKGEEKPGPQMDMFFIGEDGETYGFTKKQLKVIANFLKIVNLDEHSASRENREQA